MRELQSVNNRQSACCSRYSSTLPAIAGPCPPFLNGGHYCACPFRPPTGHFRLVLPLTALAVEKIPLQVQKILSGCNRFAALGFYLRSLLTFLENSNVKNATVQRWKHKVNQATRQYPMARYAGAACTNQALGTIPSLPSAFSWSLTNYWNYRGLQISDCALQQPCTGTSLPRASRGRLLPYRDVEKTLNSPSARGSDLHNQFAAHIPFPDTKDWLRFFP